MTMENLILAGGAELVGWSLAALVAYGVLKWMKVI